jgi:8-oxo-dGTP diphosphatase
MEKAAASIAVWNRDHVLLIKRARAPYAGFWTLPGGRLEPDEAPHEAALRELAEETGLVVKAAVPAGIHFSGGPGAGFELRVFAARYCGGEAVGSSENCGFGWFRFEQLGDLETTPGLANVLKVTLHVLANH